MSNGHERGIPTMSNREYHELMFEQYHTKAMMFAIFAILVYRDYGLGPAFACMLFETIASIISMFVCMRRANGRTND